MATTAVSLARDYDTEALVDENAGLRRQVATMGELLAAQGRRLKEKDRRLAELREHLVQRDGRI